MLKMHCKSDVYFKCFHLHILASIIETTWVLLLPVLSGGQNESIASQNDQDIA